MCADISRHYFLQHLVTTYEDLGLVTHQVLCIKIMLKKVIPEVEHGEDNDTEYNESMDMSDNVQIDSRDEKSEIIPALISEGADATENTALNTSNIHYKTPDFIFIR